MGAIRRARFVTPVALALTLAVAGAGSSSSLQRHAAADPSAGRAGAGEEPASVTLVDGAAAAPSETVGGATLTPPLHVAATVTAAHAVSQDRVAGVLLRAYRAAAASSSSSCHLPVSLLAAVGEVESGSLVGRAVSAGHRASVLGPVLDGHGFASIPDTDHGRLDGDRTWDRAVGPMQFIPSTWRTFGVDGDGDGVADPQDVEDSAAAAASYLCYGGRDLSEPKAMRTAILSYNNSDAYERLVMTYQRRYAALGLDRGASSVPTSLVTGASLGATAAGSLGDGPAFSAGSLLLEPSQPFSRSPHARRHRHHRARHGRPRHTPAIVGVVPGPTGAATTSPTSRPTTGASGTATSGPTTSPTTGPTTSPTSGPSTSPTTGPTTSPTSGPTTSPTSGPATSPTSGPTTSPTSGPATSPTTAPTTAPTAGPTCPPADPTAIPTTGPSGTPTSGATTGSTAAPTTGPSTDPDDCPTCTPAVEPNASPTAAPTSGPTTGSTAAAGPACLPVEPSAAVASSSSAP